MKKILLLLSLLTLGSQALAETTPAKLALAREVVTAMQADKMFESMKEQMTQMASRMAALPPDATPEQKKLTEEFMAGIMDLSMSEAKVMIGEMDTIYAEVYSDAELKAILAFFKSPEGQSMMTKQSDIMARLMPKIESMQQALMPKMQALAQAFQAKFAATKAAAAPAVPAAPAAVEVK